MSAPSPDDEAAGFEPTRSFPPRPGRAPAGPPPSAGTGNALPPGTRLGEFELLGVVGEGGFGIVYRAWDHSLRRQVALKEYMPASLAQRTGGLQVSVRSDKHAETFQAGLQSFVKEARMLAQFDHPALVKVFRFWEAHGSAYMAMPFYEGTTLREELRRRTAPPDEATLLGWLGPIADALAVIHAEHWYHRDIAPDNVLLLAGTGRPVLLDFGAARRVIGDMTQALTVILKPGYAPVEQYAEIPGMKQGPWTDVYALAASAYFAVRGRTPPPSVGRLVNDSFEPLAQAARGRYSERVLKAIDRALAVRPEHRTQTVAEFKADLGLAPAGHPPAPAPPRAPAPGPARPAPAPGAAVPASAARALGPAPAAPRSARRGLLAGAAVVAAAGIGGAIWWAGRRPAAPGLGPGSAPPSAPTAAAPGAAPAPAGFDPADAFRRIVAAQTPGWAPALNASATRLQRGRDTLAVTLRSPQEGLVYVLHHGPDGALRQLIPNGSMPALPVGPGQALALPAALAELGLAGLPGPAQLLVIVSRWPREMSAFAPRLDNGVISFPTGSVAAALEGANAGRLPLVAGQPRCPAGAACADEFGAAVLSYEVVR